MNNKADQTFKLELGSVFEVPFKFSLIEIRFIKFRLASRVHKSKLSPLEDHWTSARRDSTTSATLPQGGRSVRVWSPALQAGPLALSGSPDTPEQALHPPSRSRGRK